MGEQAWTLVGVVVGALLGGLAPLLTTRMQRRAAHEQWLRDRRREVYQAFLGDWHVRYDRVWDEAYEIAETPLPEDFLAPLYRLVTDIQLFGSPESSRLAEAAFQALMKFSGASRAKAAEHETTTDAAIAKYVEQVRRDLGIV